MARCIWSLIVLTLSCQPLQAQQIPGNGFPNAGMPFVPFTGMANAGLNPFGGVNPMMMRSANLYPGLSYYPNAPFVGEFSGGGFYKGPTALFTPNNVQWFNPRQGATPYFGNYYGGWNYAGPVTPGR